MLRCFTTFAAQPLCQASQWWSQAPLTFHCLICLSLLFQLLQLEGLERRVGRRDGVIELFRLGSPAHRRSRCAQLQGGSERQLWANARMGRGKRVQWAEGEAQALGSHAQKANLGTETGHPFTQYSPCAAMSASLVGFATPAPPRANTVTPSPRTLTRSLIWEFISR